MTKKKDREHMKTNMMYVQNLEHLPFKSLEELMTHIETEIKPLQVAGILHDKDISKKGNPKKPHVHVMMHFKSARSIYNIAKLLHDKSERIEKWKGYAETGFSYLIHETENSFDQYQYSSSEVIANFDYPAFLEEVRKKVKAKNKGKLIKEKTLIKNYLDALLDGKMSKEEVESKLNASQLARYHRQIDIIHQKWLENSAKKWKEKMTKERKIIRTIWLYGYAGVGKTRKAKKIAEDLKDSYFITGSNNDPFQEYIDEHIVILDELRPSAFNYSDLLKMFDPYNIGAVSPARYKDKKLVVHTFIVTTPYSPKEFYEAVARNNRKQFDVKIDTFYQLARRLHEVIRLTEDGSEIELYDKKFDDFISKNHASLRNKKNEKNQ